MRIRRESQCLPYAGFFFWYIVNSLVIQMSPLKKNTHTHNWTGHTDQKLKGKIQNCFSASPITCRWIMGMRQFFLFLIFSSVWLEVPNLRQFVPPRSIIVSTRQFVFLGQFCGSVITWAHEPSFLATVKTSKQSSSWTVLGYRTTGVCEDMQ